MDDDDDIFLYGEPSANDREPTKVEVATSVPIPVPLETVKAATNGLVENLEAKAEEEIPFGSVNVPEQTNGDHGGENGENGENGHDEQDEDDNSGEDESEDDDIEIIMDQPSRSLDLRPNRPPPGTSRTISASQSTPVRTTQPTLTTEYTPRERGAPAPPRPQQTPQTSPVQQPQPNPVQQVLEKTQTDDGLDPSTLPPVSSPPSHPSINPNMPGIVDGRSILEYDLTAMAEKPWRRPGSDISDWFNYGFDEISWEAYCYRRRDLGELADVLKTNVLNFAGMPEDQLTALPPELRTMVMTGANAMMNNASANNMMGPGVGMNPMMDISGMGGMNMGPMGMGMNGDMAMQGPMMPDGGPQGTGTPEQGVQMGMQDGYGGGGQGPAMMGMGMNNDFGMQDQGQMGQGMYPGMEGSNTPNPPQQQHQQTPVPNVPPQSVPPGPGGRGTLQGQYRGRVIPNQRARGAFAGRGRGRFGDGPAVPVRSTSPLPPNVPTGPRNANRYKDRDNNAPAVEGLDYGGGKDSGRRTPSGEPEERSRKRRISPGLDDGRGLKRR